MEEYKFVKETTRTLYYISNLGRMKSVSKRNKKERILKLGHNGTKYSVMRIGKKNYRIHRLVAQYFIPNPHNLPVVNHIVPISRGGTNELKNLEWCTRKQNMEHAKRLGLLGGKKKDEVRTKNKE